MSTTALPSKPVMRRFNTVESTPSTSTNSTVPSPGDSPVASASSTSLSSLGSIEELDQQQKLVNTWGEEFVLPDYTIKQIRDAIPAHCYKRSAATGFYYVFRDIAQLAAVFYIFNTYCTPEYVPSYAVRAVLWTFYTFVQGLSGTGVWVLAHECGHQAFSESRLLNDTVGWVLHSALLVPYFSWQSSHSDHHKATGNLARDMVFVPRTRSEHASRTKALLHEMHELCEEAPLVTLGMLLGQQLAGWPMYILANMTGHNNHEKQPEGKGIGKKNGNFSVNHFSPSSPLYKKKQEHLILLSDLGIAITAGVLSLIGYNYGLWNLTVWYIFPYLWVNHWLVAVTYLQHTDPTLPHYDGPTWNFTRGAAATIDRDFGFIGRFFMHSIIEDHVTHHHVSTIPFYNAQEATEAIKKVMGQHYRSDTKGGALGFLTAMWSTARTCQWVEPNEGAVGKDAEVMFFRNRNGIGMAPAKLSAPTEKKSIIVDDSE